MFCSGLSIRRASTTVSPSDYHSVDVMRMLWSPKICLFERRETKQPLYDMHFDMYERCLTYEGEEFHSKISKHAKLLKYKISNSSLERHFSSAQDATNCEQHLLAHAECYLREAEGAAHDSEL